MWLPFRLTQPVWVIVVRARLKDKEAQKDLAIKQYRYN